jgi:N-acetylneuraminic acid mutarotase
MAAVCSLLTGTLPATPGKLAFSRPDAPTKDSNRTLTFEERVSYQRAIEDVCWRHRIWPKERPDPKPSLDAVMSQAQIEKKVADYLRNSQALTDYWQRPITAEQLQAEMDRMAKNTKQPEVLRELFEALGNDPFVIAECLARPALAERLLTDWYADDQRIHGGLSQRAEADLRTHNTVAQMKGISGTYTEIELVKSARRQPDNNRHVKQALQLNATEWDELMLHLAAIFRSSDAAQAKVANHDLAENITIPAKPGRKGSADTWESLALITTGVVSPLQQDQNYYYATAVLERSTDRVKLATVAWRKQALGSWVATAENQVRSAIAASNSTYTLPAIVDDGCVDNTWTPTSMNAPRGRFNPTAVWSGNEMIVWGGYEFVSLLLFDTGGRYNPSTDTWVATSNNNAPEPRTHHTAVWTGTEMIVWGGNVEDHALNTGGRYNPTTDTWIATSTTNAPYYRDYHSAVWTGTQMIIWGGSDGYTTFNTGGRYNPNTNLWAPTSTVNAPQARYVHTAVWTGGEMIVWGGNGGDNYSNTLNSGGRYNPGTNTWTPTSTVNAPEGRWFHRAVWTGSEMIVWGGDHGNFVQQLNTGGRYNPATNSWSPTNLINAPTHRDSHTAVWTGNEMIVWGGWVGSGDTTTGGRYQPGTNSWATTSINNAPSARETHTAIWTGTEMIVWGGGNADDNWGLNTGGRYNPTANTWATTNGNAPTARSAHTAVWTGSEMIVWGGEGDNSVNFGAETNTGGRFSPSTDAWTPTTTLSAPSARKYHTAVWTGSEMIVWGGYFYDGNENFLNTGGIYDPATNSWTETSTTNTPTGRDLHTAIWIGSEMIVWGGSNNGVTALDTGGRYNPNTKAWLATSLTNVPSARYYHTAISSGSEMIIWGGTDYINYFNSGGRYNPSTDSWTAISATSAPSGRQGHTAVWNGSEMVIWGGYYYGGSNYYLNTGGKYNPGTDSWADTSLANAPTGRDFQTAVWTGSEMIVWGGYDGNGTVNTGGRYHPDTDSWAATSNTNAPTARTIPT